MKTQKHISIIVYCIGNNHMSKKINIKAINCPWSHDKYRLKELPKKINWVIGNDNFSAVMVFDNHIDRHLNTEYQRGIKKYAWLAESRSIIPELTKSIKTNPDKYTNKYDLIFTNDKELVRLSNNIRYVTNPASITWIKNIGIKPKSKLVSMISSNKQMCDGHKNRLNWVNKLTGVVDLYGRGFNPIDCKEVGLDDYMFSVTIENASYETYFTEKLLDCFATGTIPIYWGSPDISKIFNIDGIICLTDNFSINTLTPELYNSKIDAVEDNFNRLCNLELSDDELYEILK